MPRAISVDMQTHIEGPALTMALCYKLVRQDTIEYYFTAHDKNLNIDGYTYRADISFIASNLESKAGLSVDNAEFTLPLITGGITKADVIAGLFYGARLDVFWVNWNNLTMGVIYEGKNWQLGKHRLKENQVIFEVRSLSSFLKVPILQMISPDCPYTFGYDDGLQSRCPANLANYLVTGSVLWPDEIEPKRIFTDSNRNEASDIWQYGKITWSSGNNSGYSKEIERFNPDDSEMTLLFDMPYDIETGDEYNLWQGCDKKFATCQAFGFQVDFGGEPNVPDQDTALQYKIDT